MWIIYNIGIYLYFLILSPYYILNLLTQVKYRAGLKSRLSLNVMDLELKCRNKRIIWFHAVSVGEVIAIIPLIDSIRKEIQNYNILLSTTTMTSNRLAQKYARENGIEAIYFPLDFSWAVRRVINAVNPVLIVLTETELWPNFLRYAARQDIPVAIINGRISNSSLKSYLVIKGFFKKIISGIKIFGMQSEDYRRNIIKLGADSGKTVISGNLKYAALEKQAVTSGDARLLKTLLNIPADNTVIFGGSTHQGEEEILIDIFAELRKEFRDISLFIAPRHIERAAAIVNIVREKGLRAALKTKIVENHKEGYDIIVLDTIGELSKLYSIADIVFVGKSLTAAGGQNVLEPARLGKAVVFGSKMDNFRNEAAALLSGGGAVQVESPAELKKVMAALLINKEKIKSIGANAAKVVDKYSVGIMEKNVSLLKGLLGKNQD